MARKSVPWWRAERGEWFSTVRGRQVRLGVTDPNDRAGAEAALEHIKANLAKPDIADQAGQEDLRKPEIAARVALNLARELLTVLPQVLNLESRERRLTWLGMLVVDLKATLV